MLFFIAGVGPRTIALDGQARSCPNCGRFDLHSKRVDEYFSLFFIPLFRVRKGEAFLSCGNCGAVYGEYGGPGQEEKIFREQVCPSCGRRRETNFKYCPECGKRF